MRYVWIIGIGLCAGLLSGCERASSTPRPTKAQLIEAQIEERLTKYTRTYRQRCYKDALAEAEIRVDSILLARAFGTRDTTGRPPKPIKPERPVLLTPKDSLNWVAPLVE